MEKKRIPGVSISYTQLLFQVIMKYINPLIEIIIDFLSKKDYYRILNQYLICSETKSLPDGQKNIQKSEKLSKKMFFSTFFLLSCVLSRDGMGQAVKIPSRRVPSQILTEK